MQKIILIFLSTYLAISPSTMLRKCVKLAPVLGSSARRSLSKKLKQTTTNPLEAKVKSTLDSYQDSYEVLSAKLGFSHNYNLENLLILKAKIAALAKSFRDHGPQLQKDIQKCSYKEADYFRGWLSFLDYEIAALIKNINYDIKKRLEDRS